RTNCGGAAPGGSRAARSVHHSAPVSDSTTGTSVVRDSDIVSANGGNPGATTVALLLRWLSPMRIDPRAPRNATQSWATGASQPAAAVRPIPRNVWLVVRVATLTPVAVEAWTVLV